VNQNCYARRWAFERTLELTEKHARATSALAKFVGFSRMELLNEIANWMQFNQSKWIHWKKLLKAIELNGLPVFRQGVLGKDWKKKYLTCVMESDRDDEFYWKLVKLFG